MFVPHLFVSNVLLVRCTWSERLTANSCWGSWDGGLTSHCWNRNIVAPLALESVFVIVYLRVRCIVATGYTNLTHAREYVLYSIFTLVYKCKPLNTV